MSKNIWVISDTHLSHANILKFVDSEGNLTRGARFSNTREMDEFMLERWNSVVKPGDKVYHLGDVMFGDRDYFARLWPKFHGSKRLTPGNHEDIKYMSSGGFFSKIQLWRVFSEFGLILSHFPLHESQLYDHRNDRPLKSVHGHVHTNSLVSDNHINVSVEVIDYTPVNIEELRIY